MKKIFAIFYCCFITAIAVAQEKTVPIWYTPVQKPATEGEQYYYNFAPVDLAKDLAELLQKSTGLRYNILPFDGKTQSGIFLLLDSTKKLGNEAAIVNADGKTFIKIVGKFATGLSYGLYTYLEKAGFKFYLPGDNWTIIPKLSSIYKDKIINEEWKPYFKVRTFFMSGAMRPVKGLDPANDNFRNWNIWYRRNRMGSEYISMGGHIGELFNMEHQKIIQADSMILAPVNGKRGYNGEGKLDPTYQKGVNLFIDWIIQQYKKDNSVVPYYIPYKTFQSVDPGDGLNYCHSPECLKRFGTISNQVFTIANKAAVQIKKTYPGAGVNLYAYTERADTPALKIEDNVHVCIVATAFQNVGTPAGLINRWSKKTKHTSIYDYLSICTWSKDHPFFDLNQYFNYLNFLKSRQVEGFTFEAGGSSFGAGLIQYFILKYLCNPYADVQKEFDTFCKEIFGNAAEPIKKMLQEWYFAGNEKTGHTYEQVSYNETELGRYVNFIQQATAANGLTDIQKKRVFELKAYVVYLAKYFELTGDMERAYLNKDNTTFNKNKTDEIMNYTWMLYPTMLFHNTQLTDLLKKYFAGDDALNKKWDYNYSDYFRNITIDAERKVNAEFSKTYARYSSQAAPFFYDINTLLSKAYLYRADTIKLKMIDGASFVNYRNSVSIFCAEPTTIKINYKAMPAKTIEDKAASIGFISLIKDDYSLIDERPVYLNKQDASISFSLPARGNYQLYLGQNNATEFDYTILPGKTLFYINKFVIPMNGIMVMDNADRQYKINDKLAFYTADADSITYSMIYADKYDYLNIFNSDGVRKTLSINKPPYRMSVKLNSNEKNSFMYFVNGVFRWPPAFKTIPNYFFYLKFPLKAKN